MKERGILFNYEMVRAVLDGSKTQTRRIVKTNASGRAQLGGRSWRLDDQEAVKACPYGSIGDRLYVRETFALEHQADKEQKPPFDDGRTISFNDNWWVCPHYRATDPTPELDYEDGEGPKCIWKPSIHMPRWASRITLEITGVRVERLHDISEIDAKSEGTKPYMLPCHPDVGPCKAAYSQLWSSINGEGSWDANPLVWVIEFERIK